MSPYHAMAAEIAQGAPGIDPQVAMAQAAWEAVIALPAIGQQEFAMETGQRAMARLARVGGNGKQPRTMDHAARGLREIRPRHGKADKSWKITGPQAPRYV